MAQRTLYGAKNIWSKFPTKTRDGRVHNMQIKDLDSNSIDKFLDFFMKYFVARENYHVICGVPSSKKAMDEYRDIFKNRLENYSDIYKFVICLQDKKDEDFDILGFSGLKLLTKDCINEDITEFKTEEVKRYFDLDFLLYKLSPTPNLLRSLPNFYEDQGAAIHPKYCSLGLATELFFTRRKICTAHNVPAGGAWTTTIKSVEAALHLDAEVVRDMGPDELFKELGIKIQKNQDMVAKYVLYKKLDEQYMESTAREFIAATKISKNV